MCAAELNESMWETIKRDWHANPRDPKARAILVGFRVAQATSGSSRVPAPVKALATAAYRFGTEWMLGIELRPKTSVGSGLRLYHGFGTVIHDHTVIGKDVVLRHGVTLGHARPGGRCPVVEDGVEFGAGSIAIGDIRIGANAIVGAGAVVTNDVPANSRAVGNPARVITGSEANGPG